MTTKILQKEAPVLRKIAVNISISDISSSKIRSVINQMKEALESQDDGVAIAAPQIGHSLRIFIISHRVDEIIAEVKTTKVKNKAREDFTSKDLIFINPIIKKISKEKETIEEGCLSVRHLYGQVSRSKKATVVALDENGNKFERGGTGLLAQIFQHEMDHLDGVLFIDKAQNVEEIFPEDVRKHKKTRIKK